MLIITLWYSFVFGQLRTKSDEASVGRLSLNLTGFTQETASIFGNQLNNVIDTLLPYSCVIPLTIEYLNTAMLQPKKDNQTGRYSIFPISYF
jgi:Mini-chromosome maintenance replisome factor